MTTQMITSVTQKNVPSTVVYYYCAWYVFLQTDVTVFSHVVFVPEYFTLLNTDNRLPPQILVALQLPKKNTYHGNYTRKYSRYLYLANLSCIKRGKPIQYSKA